jgi:hypothetical protein
MFSCSPTPAESIAPGMQEQAATNLIQRSEALFKSSAHRSRHEPPKLDVCRMFANRETRHSDSAQHPWLPDQVYTALDLQVKFGNCRSNGRRCRNAVRIIAAQDSAGGSERLAKRRIGNTIRHHQISNVVPRNDPTRVAIGAKPDPRSVHPCQSAARACDSPIEAYEAGTPARQTCCGFQGRVGGVARICRRRRGCINRRPHRATVRRPPAPVSHQEGDINRVPIG